MKTLILNTSLLILERLIILRPVGLVSADGYAETTYIPNELGSRLLTLLKHE